MKKLLISIILSILLTGCNSLFYKAVISTQNNVDEYESLVYSDPRIDIYKSLAPLDNKLISFNKLDSSSFREVLRNRFLETKSNNLFIYFWSLAYSDSLLNWDELKKIQNNAKKKLLIISFDISSRDQIELVKHYLYNKGIMGQFYIIQTKSSTIAGAIEDMKTLSSFYSVHNNLKFHEGTILTMPALYVIDKEMNVITKSNLNDIDFTNKILDLLN